MKDHSWLFSFTQEITKTLPTRQPHKIGKHLGFCTEQTTLTDFFLIPGERKAAELAHGTGAVSPSWCSSPRAPQIENAVYTGSVSTPCLFCSEELCTERAGVQSQFTAGREGEGNLLQWAKRLHLPSSSPTCCSAAPGLAFRERSGLMLD